MKRGDSGMTLMELLIVISILGLLVTLVLPFSGRMSDNTKKKETVQLLESIRFGLLGAENAYDANGNRVLGGYVGEYGTLPDFVIHEWDDSANEWIIPLHGSIANAPEVLDYNASASHYDYDTGIMPLALWTNLIKIESLADYQPIMPHADWLGPYVEPPRDDYPDDDNLYTYSALTGTPSTDEGTRHFFLRQGEERLVDGWGSSLLIYFDDKKNLYFVSAGSDRRINYGLNTPGITTPVDLGPADPRLPNNEDNIILVISHEQWNLDGQKIATTRQKLNDLKLAILGQRGNVTDGVSQPNGFIADMGNIEILTGSYVYDGSSDIYRCIKDTTVSPLSGSSDWVKVTDGTVVTANDYPFVPTYDSSAGTLYKAPQPKYLVMNADYVKVVDAGVVGGFRYYRYIEDTPSAGNAPSNSSTFWVEDDTFKGHDWVPLYANSTTYKKEDVLDPWTYHSNVGFGAGWRGPYTSYSETPLHDAWGRPMSFELAAQGTVVIRSSGPLVSTTSDDIIESFDRTNYAVPVQVEVKNLTTTHSNDYVSIYGIFNGKVAYIHTQLETGAGGDAIFRFDQDLRDIIEPLPAGLVDVTLATPTLPNATGSSYPAAGGVWLPVGNVMAVYRNQSAYTSPLGYQKRFILHPKTSSIPLTLGD